MSVTSMVKANAQMCAFEVRAHIQFILKGLASSHQVLALYRNQIEQAHTNVNTKKRVDQQFFGTELAIHSRGQKAPA